jgi:hypothetical protein
MEREHEGTIVAEQTSQPYVGQWNRLISTTNWEKGRIIHQWRTALRESGAVATEYSDEVWSGMVRGVAGQHVGRLRRVFERFGDSYSQYAGLYWSHFQAALDWEDAEMWLEGSIQNGWSVSAMRRQRWETLHAAAGDEPREDDLVAVEIDEDYHDAERSASVRVNDRDERVTEGYTAEARSPAGPDFGDDDRTGAHVMSGEVGDFADGSSARPGTPAERVRPFAELNPLPDDLAAPFESFQLAILRHKSEQWVEVSLDDVLASLDALKALALAPVA